MQLAQIATFFYHIHKKSLLKFFGIGMILTINNNQS